MEVLEWMNDNWTTIAAGIGTMLATLVAVLKTRRGKPKGPPPGTGMLLALAFVAPSLTGCGAATAPTLHTMTADACDALEGYVVARESTAEQDETDMRRVRLACDVLLEVASAAQ